MEDLRPDALETVAARVVAWHNRHPLAHRISVEQVQSVGYVALPYLPPPDAAATGKAPPAAAAAGAPEAAAGGSLRERALARAQQAGGAGEDKAGKAAKPEKPAKRGKAAQSRLKAAFTEDFIAPLSPRRVARWAARHGVAAAQAPRGAPLRQVDPDPAFAGQARELQTLYVLTAAVESRGKRLRMLLSPGADEAVLGNHLWSPPRLAGGGVAALGGLVALGLALTLLWQPAPKAVVAGPASQGGTVQVESAAGSAAMQSIKPPSLRTAALADAGMADAASPPAAAASKPAAAPPTQAPADVQPTLGRIQLPSLGMPRVDEALAAARERRLAQIAGAASAPVPVPPAAAPASGPMQTRSTAAATATAPAPTTSPTTAPLSPAGVAAAPTPAAAPAQPAAPPAPSKPQLDAVPPPGQVFALSSRRLRTRAESDQTMAAVKSLLAGSGMTSVQVEVVPAEDDWRVVGWPFTQRAQAEKARTLLASRGIRLEIVDF